jgi:hypothetical protein
MGFNFNIMITTTIDISNPDPKYYLTNILKDYGYNGQLPTNTIINKRRPSIGATYNELHAHRHSIIIEPYITVIEVKKKNMGDKICAVIKDFDPLEIEAYLENINVEFKKIVTTPESFNKVIRALKEYDRHYRKTFFLLIDECDKLIQHALFRNKVFSPMEEFFKFDGKAMVSATPIVPSHPEFEIQGFTYLDLKPTFDYKKYIKLIVTNNIRASLRNTIKLLKLKNDGKPVFLFTNCKRTILYFTRLEHVKPNFRVFCAEDLIENFFLKNGVLNVNSSVVHQKYADYNAFTSRFFAAVDMHPHDYAHIIIVTNLPFVPHSIVDPATDTIQICGRDRKQAQDSLKQHGTITHITNLYPKEMIGEDVDTKCELYFIDRLKDLATKASNANIKTFIENEIDKQLIAQTLKEDGTIESFLKDNYDFVKYSKRLYQSGNALLNVYNESDYFKPTMINVRHEFSDSDELILIKSKGGKQKNKVFIAQLHRLLNSYEAYADNLDEFTYHLKRLEEEDVFLFNAYHQLGYAEIESLNFSKNHIKDEIFKRKQAEPDNYFLMVDKILATFKLNIKHYVDSIKDKLQSIYMEFQFEKNAGEIYVAKGSDIEKYFICKRANDKKQIDGKYKSYYRLLAPVDKISSDLNFLMAN